MQTLLEGNMIILDADNAQQIKTALERAIQLADVCNLNEMELDNREWVEMWQLKETFESALGLL